MLKSLSFWLILSFASNSYSAIPVPPPGNLCPSPDLNKCQESGYLQAACGKMHRARCETLIGAEFKRIAATYPVSTEPKLGNSNATNVREEIHTFSSYYLSGMEGSSRAYTFRNQLFSLKKEGTLTPLEFMWLIIKQGWENNGHKIESCHEYAFERFYDLMPFETRMSQLEHQDRKIYELAIANKNIRSGLRSKDGATFNIVLPTNLQPKNSFFKYKLNFWYPNGREGAFVFNPELVKIIEQGNRTSYNHWIWHEVMGETFKSDKDALMSKHYYEQKAYEKLVGSRDSVQKRWEASVFALVYRLQKRGATAAQIATEVKSHNIPFIAELNQIDQKIQDSILGAGYAGCLKLNEATLCDWSPELFVEQFKESIAKMRETEVSRCKTYTAGDFSQDSRIVRLGGNVSTTQADRYFTAYQAELDNLPFTPNPATGKPIVGEEDSDDAGFGNEYFGIGYDFSSSWGAKDFQKTTEKARDATFGLKSRFKGYVKLMAQKIDILDAKGDIGTRKIPMNESEREVHAGLSVKIFGNDILTPIDQSQRVELSISKDNLSLEKRQGISSTIIVVAIPITLEVGMSGKIGLRTAMSADLERNCSRDVAYIGLSGMIEPFVNVSGYASAAVDLVVVSVGVRGELTLLDLGLPFKVTGKITPMSRELVLSSSAGLDLEVETLSGRVVLFVDYTTDEAKKTIAKWKGKREVFPLMRNKPIKDVSLTLIKQM